MAEEVFPSIQRQRMKRSTHGRWTIQLFIAGAILALIVALTDKRKTPDDILNRVNELEEELGDKIKEETGVVQASINTTIQNHDRLLRIMEEVGVAAIIANKDHEIVYWSPFAEKLFGYSAEEALKMKVEDLMRPENREVHRKLFRKRVAEGADYGHTVSCDDAESKDGDQLFLSLTLFISKNSDEILGLFRELPPYQALPIQQAS